MEGETYPIYGNGVELNHKVRQTFHKNFVQVQSLLDQNRLLINEINHNHESNIPHNLNRNVGLIRELNNNIRRVVLLYADLSSSLASYESAGDFNGGGGGRSGMFERFLNHNGRKRKTP
ncbi:hypothetical protein MKW94_020028 [Papaver nudicaule]|uniref:Protein EARLY FLOWERING 4 domain-containing protein n=1 Tax=Papaver nudicaule TaxID=74823 RepID=A0AA41SDK5_PAPNU|nr:hypothetical protein [Papaver nudicaule]